MGTNLLRKNKGNEISLKLKAYTFYQEVTFRRIVAQEKCNAVPSQALREKPVADQMRGLLK